MVDLYVNGDPQQLEAVLRLSWEMYWMWLDNQVEKLRRAASKKPEPMRKTGKRR
jgi:hypothetical protein